MFTKSLCALALITAATTAQAELLLQEEFNNVLALPAAGWMMNNASTPGGLTNWFQGDQNQLLAHAGDPEAYIAANFNNSMPGGTINNWLITPEFSTATNVLISFWVRGVAEMNYMDKLAYGTSSGGSALSDFHLGPVFTAPTGDWTQYYMMIDAAGAGSTARFALQYSGDADTSNYVGFDSLTITSVPEPAGLLLLSTGLLGLLAARRRLQA